MVYLVHLAGCAYYGFSKIEGIGSTRKINWHNDIIYETIGFKYCVENTLFYFIKNDILIIM